MDFEVNSGRLSQHVQAVTTKYSENTAAVTVLDA